MAENQKTNSYSVQEAVFLSLRKSIMTLNLMPGTTMSANEISARFNVSRTPVREAFIRLEREGLVKIVPQRETMVSRINPKRVSQERFLRESLEIAALEPFMINCSEKNIQQLRQLIEKQRAMSTEKEFAKVVDYDDAFHRIIFEVAEQPLSWEIIESMSGHYRRIRVLTVWSDEILKNIVEQHEALVLQVESGNLKLAREVLNRHLRKLIREEETLIEKYPDFFEKKEQTDLFNIDFGDLNTAH